MEHPMTIPELKQSDELKLADFERHPVWIGVHGLDEARPWYARCNEATYRPWTRDLPISGRVGKVFVSSRLDLADGTGYPGFVRLGL